MRFPRLPSIVFLAPVILAQQTTSGSESAKLAAIHDHTIEAAGKITKLEITADLEIALAGTYRLTFELTAGGGGGLTGKAQRHLETGTQKLTVAFDSVEIVNNLRQDGPYSISDVRLSLEHPAGDITLADTPIGAVSTAAYRLSDFYINPFSFTGEIEAEGTEPQSSGKFLALRVRIGVITPGAICSGWGRLSDSRGTEIEKVNAESSQKLPSGKGWIDLLFHGAKIAAHAVDGPFTISEVALSCAGTNRGEGQIQQLVEYRTKALRAAEFDNPLPDFELKPIDGDYRMPAGGSVMAQVLLQTIGRSENLIGFTIRTPDSRLRNPDPRWAFPCDCWHVPLPVTFSLTAARDLPPGNYPVQITAHRGGRERTVELTIVVDAELTRLAREHEEGIEALARPDPPPSTPPKSVPNEEARPAENAGARFSAGVSLRKMHAVLVIDHSRNPNFFPGCGLVNPAAIRFSRLFVEGRDSLGVVSFGINASLVLPLTDHFGNTIDASVAKIPCQGLGANLGAALDAAQKELVRHADPDAINAVVLITASQPDALSATWSSAKQPDGTYCAESNAGQVGAIVQDSYAGSPDGPIGPLFLPPDTADPHQSLTSEQLRERWRHLDEFDGRRTSCFGWGFYRAKSLYPTIPEHDLNGIALTGTYPLERFATGPYVSQIRMDIASNLRNAARNQTENLARAIRSGQNPIVLHAILLTPPLHTLRTFLWSALFGLLANTRKIESFDSSQPEGLVILVDGPKAVWPAFERVRQDLVERATVK
jgi:hypothetical protein